MKWPRRIAGVDGKVVWTPVPSLAKPLVQSARGYRFGPENLLLPSLLTSRDRQARRVVDLGAGCGVLGLVTQAATAPDAHLTLVERNDTMAALCRANIAASEAHATLCHDDLRTAHLPSAELVVANPPFFADGSGQPSKNPTTHGATHSLHGGLDAFVAAAKRTMTTDGACWLLYPADGLAEVFATLAAHELHASDLAVVYARHTGRPYRVWVRALPTPGRLSTTRLSTLTNR